MPGRAGKLIITERQQAILRTMTRPHLSSSPRPAGRMILLAFDGSTTRTSPSISDANAMRSGSGGAAGLRPSSAWSWSNAARGCRPATGHRRTAERLAPQRLPASSPPSRSPGSWPSPANRPRTAADP